MTQLFEYAQSFGLILLVGVLGWSAGAAESASEQEGIDPENLPPEMTRSLEELLNDPEGYEVDRKETRCINRRSGLQTEILDGEHLLIKSNVGGRAWLNRMTPGCVGMRPDMVLIIEGRSANLCQFDQVEGRSRLGLGGVSSGRCALGKFEPVTELHAKTLSETFKLRRKDMAKARSRERVERRKQRRKDRKERRAARRAEKAASATAS